VAAERGSEAVAPAAGKTGVLSPTPARRGSARTHRPALDGLRGIAALVVVFRHLFNRIALAPDVRLAVVQSPLALLVNGQGAVQLFFVLSGWVLAASLARSRERAPWPQFYVKRVFRIHPPYVAAVLVALATTAALAAAGALPVARRGTGWPGAATFATWLAFPSSAGGILPVGWTLTVEMIYSILLPPIVLLARPGRGLPLLLATAVLAFLAPVNVGLYGFDFALGVVAQREQPTLAAAFHRLPSLLRGAAVVLGAVLLCAPLLFWPRLVRNLVIAGWTPADITLMGVGAALLVVTAVNVPGFGRLLSSDVGLFLGRVSYPLYLLHPTVLLLFDPLRYGSTVDVVALFVAGPTAAIIASMPFHRWVELPSIALGTRVCAWIAPRLGARPLESHAAEAP
jgi:peptidoglycan/LPS O-acetylase OafA/YrhL